MAHLRLRLNAFVALLGVASLSSCLPLKHSGGSGNGEGYDGVGDKKTPPPVELFDISDLILKSSANPQAIGTACQDTSGEFGMALVYVGPLTAGGGWGIGGAQVTMYHRSNTTLSEIAKYVTSIQTSPLTEGVDYYVNIDYQKSDPGNAKITEGTGQGFWMAVDSNAPRTLGFMPTRLNSPVLKQPEFWCKEIYARPHGDVSWVQSSDRKSLLLRFTGGISDDLSLHSQGWSCAGAPLSCNKDILAGSPLAAIAASLSNDAFTSSMRASIPAGESIPDPYLYGSGLRWGSGPVKLLSNVEKDPSSGAWLARFTQHFSAFGGMDLLFSSYPDWASAKKKVSFDDVHRFVDQDSIKTSDASLYCRRIGIGLNGFGGFDRKQIDCRLDPQGGKVTPLPDLSDLELKELATSARPYILCPQGTFTAEGVDVQKFYVCHNAGDPIFFWPVKIDLGFYFAGYSVWGAPEIDATSSEALLRIPMPAKNISIRRLQKPYSAKPTGSSVQLLSSIAPQQDGTISYSFTGMGVSLKSSLFVDHPYPIEVTLDNMKTVIDLPSTKPYRPGGTPTASQSSLIYTLWSRAPLSSGTHVITIKAVIPEGETPKPWQNLWNLEVVY